MWSKSTFIRIGTFVATALVLGGIAPRPALAGDGDPSCGFTVDGQPGESLDVEIDPAFLEGFPSDLTLPDGFGLLAEYLTESSDLFDPSLIDVVLEKSNMTIWILLSATSNAGDEVEEGVEGFPSGLPSYFYLVYPLIVGMDIAVFGDPSSYPLEVTFSAGDVADDLPDYVAAGALCSFTFTFDIPGQSRRNPIDLDHYLDRAEAGALPNTL